MSESKIGGLLVSAGLSSRMGNFKPLMEYNGETYVIGITRKLIQVCSKVVIVTGFQKEKVESTINSQSAFGGQVLNLPTGRQGSQLGKVVSCVNNPDYEKGMFTSLQTGAKCLKDCDWVLYHFVDQPFHKEKFYEELILQADDNYNWIQPVYNNKEGHPIMFNKRVIELILYGSQNATLRLIGDLPAIKKKYWNCSYPNILKDYDTPDDISKSF
jgi:molybdenum cofactor cytidylyltransferase